LEDCDNQTECCLIVFYKGITYQMLEKDEPFVCSQFHLYTEANFHHPVMSKKDYNPDADQGTIHYQWSSDSTRFQAPVG
jgi:hypothetical protein